MNKWTIWWDIPIWFIKITGMQMDCMSLKIEVGEHPKIKINLSIKGLLEEMKEEELKKLIEYSNMRLKYLK